MSACSLTVTTPRIALSPLVQVMQAEYVPVWLSEPNRALDHKKPIDLVARGRYERVARLISSLESPGAV